MIAKILRALAAIFKPAEIADAPKQPRRGGRPRTYHQERKATDAERKRRQRWRADGKVRHESHETRFRDCHETPPSLREQKNLSL
jgi:hypothetical protein